MAERESFVDFSIPYYDMIGTVILVCIYNSSSKLGQLDALYVEYAWQKDQFLKPESQYYRVCHGFRLTKQDA